MKESLLASEILGRDLAYSHGAPAGATAKIPNQYPYTVRPRRDTTGRPLRNMAEWAER